MEDEEIERLLALYAEDIARMGTVPPERRGLVVGQRVGFDVVQGPPGPRAVRVFPVHEDIDADGHADGHTAGSAGKPVGDRGGTAAVPPAE